LLHRVRTRIRRDSLADGVLLLCSAFVCIFWLTWLIDEAWFGLQKLELPVGLRLVLLVFLLPSAIWLILRRIAYPLVRRIRDCDLALLVERRFPLFQDRLVTTVEAATTSRPESQLSAQMLQRSIGDAERIAAQVDSHAVFDTKQLKRESLAAGGLVCSLIIASLFQPGILTRWFQAFVWCVPEYRERTTSIEAWVIAQPGDRRLPFIAPGPGQPAVCRHPVGADLELEFLVPDSGPAPGLKWTIPDRLRVDVIRQDGSRSRSWITAASAGRFRFVVTQLRESIDIEVLGGDFRSRLPWHVEAVDSPGLDAVEIECTYPEYTGWNQQRERRLEITGSEVQLPEGTEFTLRARSGKLLKSVRVVTDQYEFSGDERSGKVIPRNGSAATDLPNPILSADFRTVQLQLAVAANTSDSRPPDTTAPASNLLQISSNTNLRFFLHDKDNIISASPETLRVAGIPDKPPVVAAQLAGIGNAVTRRARIPLAIRVRDDYGVQTAGFEFQVDDETSWRPRPFRIALAAGTLEFSSEQPEYFELQPLELTEGQSLTLSVTAIDRNPLTGGSLARSTPLPFRIVSDDELLSLLYTREIALRSRFEELIARLEEVRKDLQFHATAAQRVDSAGSTAAREDLAAIDSCGNRSINTLRRQANELSAIIAAFEEILQQLVNNSIPLHNAETMQVGIVDPLRQIRDTGMPAADRAVAAVRAAALASQPILPPLQQAENILSELISSMKNILESVRDMAEFHEAVRDLQQLSEEQKKVLEETKRLQKNDALNNLLNK
jgi:hypothetical protein